MLVILPCGQGVSSYLALPASRTTYVHQFIILCCYKTKALFNHLFLIKNKSTKRLQPHGDKEKIMGNAMVALKTAEEVKAVSAELARNTKTNLFRCLWAMQFESALRFGDAVKLTWDQFAEGKTHLSIKQEKTGKLHKVAITPAMHHWSTSQNCWARQTRPAHCFTSGSRRRLRTHYQKSFLSGKNGNDEKM